MCDSGVTGVAVALLEACVPTSESESLPCVRLLHLPGQGCYISCVGENESALRWWDRMTNVWALARCVVVFDGRSTF